jgi:hypothetical protein
MARSSAKQRTTPQRSCRACMRARLRAQSRPAAPGARSSCRRPRPCIERLPSLPLFPHAPAWFAASLTRAQAADGPPAWLSTVKAELPKRRCSQFGTRTMGSLNPICGKIQRSYSPAHFNFSARFWEPRSPLHMSKSRRMIISALKVLLSLGPFSCACKSAVLRSWTTPQTDLKSVRLDAAKP